MRASAFTKWLLSGNVYLQKVNFLDFFYFKVDFQTKMKMFTTLSFFINNY